MWGGGGWRGKSVHPCPICMCVIDALLLGFTFPNWVPCAGILVSSMHTSSLPSLDHEGHRVLPEFQS